MSSQKQMKQYRQKKIAAVILSTLVLTAAFSVAAYTRTNNNAVEADVEETALSAQEMANVREEVNIAAEDMESSMTLQDAFDVKPNEESMTEKFSENAALAADNGDENSDVEINIENWVNVSIDLRGKELTKDVPAGTVADALAYLNITLAKNDEIDVSLGDEVEDGMKFTVTQTKTRTVTKTETVDYKVIEKETDSLYEGETQIETYGVEGERTIVTKVTYVNGKKTKTKTVSDEITTEPVDQVVLVGTAEKVSYFNNDGGNVSVNESSNTITDKFGNTVSYSYCLSGPATAYYAPAGAGTSTGRLARYGVVAVDPNEIPYGSILYIVSTDGYVYGYAVAGDTGGFIYYTDVLVDVFFPTYDDCCSWGLRNVNVYVLEGVSEDMTYYN